GVKKFIFASTGGAIYSKKERLPWVETNLTEPESPYGLGKMAVEHYLRIYSDRLDSAVLRFSNVYGPRQNAKGEAGVVAIFMDNALHKKPLKVFGDGKQTRDFIYVVDVVRANLHVMETNLSGCFNVSTGFSTSVNDIVNLVRQRTPVDVEYLP